MGGRGWEWWSGEAGCRTASGVLLMVGWLLSRSEEKGLWLVGGKLAFFAALEKGLINECDLILSQ